MYLFVIVLVMYFSDMCWWYHKRKKNIVFKGTVHLYNCIFMIAITNGNICNG